MSWEALLLLLAHFTYSLSAPQTKKSPHQNTIPFVPVLQIQGKMSAFWNGTYRVLVVKWMPSPPLLHLVTYCLLHNNSSNQDLYVSWKREIRKSACKPWSSATCLVKVIANINMTFKIKTLKLRLTIQVR